MAKDWQRKYQQEKRSQLLKEFDGWTEREFIAHIFELREEISELERELSGHATQRKAEAAKNASEQLQYKQEWSYPTKIHFLLHQQQKPLRSEDLHNLLLNVDAHYKDYDSPANNLNVSLARMVKSGRIKRVKLPGVLKSYYALPEWIELNNALKDQYNAHIKPF